MKLAIIAISLALAGSAQAQTATEKYDLEERCGRRAAEVFAKHWEVGRQATFNYENHYNSRLNKCFFIIYAYQGGKAAMVLFDLNENKQIAVYAKTEGEEAFGFCFVQEKRCASEAEWRALIKPFMED